MALLCCLLLPVLAPAASWAGTPAAAGTEPRRLPVIRLHGSALEGAPRTVTVDELDGLAAQTEWTIVDPYRRQDARYRGIQLRDLVAALAPRARQVRMRAINDYITVFERREWESLPILLATRDNDARMSVDRKGPARIIYRQTRDNEMAMQVNAPKWIWQVIDVEFIGE
ncbi:MAG: hypothetical protein ACOY33_04010 [Pseudomonadota bacterium]